MDSITSPESCNSNDDIKRMVGWIETFLGGLLSLRQTWIDRLVIKPKNTNWSDHRWARFCTEMAGLDWSGMKNFADTIGLPPGSVASLVIESDRVYFEDDMGKKSDSLFRHEKGTGWVCEPYYYSNQFHERDLSNWLIYNP